MPTLNWIGKDKVINHHLDVPFRVLEHKYGFSKEHGESEGKETNSGNKIIHGDNLEALKTLLPEYEGRINCIYIDPPYNTGNEGWVYNDNVNDPKLKKWLHEVVGKEGEDLTRHDKWLCMIYPRLRLLHHLLSENGVFFVSIDDNEQPFLRIVLDEIFGKNNFLAQFTWRTDGNFDNQAKVKNCHEYILAYFKDFHAMGLPSGIDPSIPSSSKLFNSHIRNTLVKNGPKNPVSEVELPAGFPCSEEFLVIKIRDNAWPHYLDDALINDFKLQNTIVVKSGWSSKDLLIDFIKNNCEPIVDSKGQKTWFEISKTGAIEIIKERSVQSHIISVISGLGSTQNMSNELLKMNIKFSFPKPTDLLEYLIKLYDKEDLLILDSFAGSGTTAHSVLNLNKLGGNRTFILIEMEDYAEEVTAERVKRVINGYANNEGTGGSFDYYTLGEPLFDKDKNINENISIEKIRQYIWYTETHTAFSKASQQLNPYYLNTCNNTAYYFYYEKDKQTVLDYEFLATLQTKAEQTIIYADSCIIADDALLRNNIVFKKIPRDIKRF
jgi:adenine-specific DNA-methyltransferase